MNRNRIFKAWFFGAQITLLAFLLIFPQWIFAAELEDPMTAYLRRRPPNVLLIVADDLGYGDLGCYGQARIKTPNLDRLAAEGTRFTQFYAGSTVCAPSRAVLMTGLHTGHSRIRGNEQRPLLAEDVTLGKVLEKAGYQTAAFGKWGLGSAGSSGVPNRQGFQEWYGFLDQVAAHNYYPASLYRNEAVSPIAANEGGHKGVYVQDLFNRATTNYLRTARFRPFFLYLPYTLPHPNNELGQATGNGMETPTDAPYTHETWPQAEKNKAAMISRLDADIGLVLSTLKSYGEHTNTVILFTSDNGPHSEGGVKAEFHKSSGPLRGIKRDLYEGGIRVPMIAWWPGHIPANRVSSEVWTFWDVLPTAAAFARTEPPKNIDGISFQRELVGLEQTNHHDFLYWEFHEEGTKQAVRMGDWKAVRNELNQALELYDLKEDQAETRNLASQHPEIVAKIEAYLKSARTENEFWPLKPKPPQPKATQAL